MRQRDAWVRLTAVVLATVVLLTLAAPARAEADVLVAAAIASVVIIGVILIVYLIVANTRDSRTSADAPRPTLVACLPSDAGPRDCRPLGEVVPPPALREIAQQS